MKKTTDRTSDYCLTSASLRTSQSCCVRAIRQCIQSAKLVASFRLQLVIRCLPTCLAPCRVLRSITAVIWPTHMTYGSFIRSKVWQRHPDCASIGARLFSLGVKVRFFLVQLVSRSRRRASTPIALCSMSEPAVFFAHCARSGARRGVLRLCCM